MESWGSEKLDASRDSLNYPLADFSHTLKNHNRVPEQPRGRPRQRSVSLFLMLTLPLLTFCKVSHFLEKQGEGRGRRREPDDHAEKQQRLLPWCIIPSLPCGGLDGALTILQKKTKNKTLQALSTPAFSWQDAVILTTGTFCSVMLSHSLRRPPLS